MQIENKQRQKKSKKQANKGKKKAKKTKDAFNVIVDDEFSFSGKSIYSLSYVLHLRYLHLHIQRSTHYFPSSNYIFYLISKSKQLRLLSHFSHSPSPRYQSSNYWLSSHPCSHPSIIPYPHICRDATIDSSPVMIPFSFISLF